MYHNIIPEDVRNIKPVESPDQIKPNLAMYEQAHKHNLTLSGYLERLDPSKPGDESTAFERQLALHDIRVQSNPKHGLYADTFEKFFVTDSTRSLFPEYINNVARWAALWSEDDPYDINLIVSNSIGLNENGFRAMYVSDSEAGYREGESSEKGSFPRITITWSERLASMKKYGLQIDWSYEFARRARIDVVRPVIERAVGVRNRDVFRDGLDLILNGDGTTMSPAATSETAVTYDTTIAANGSITYLAWLKWLYGFRPYVPDVVITTFDVAYKIMTMTRANVDTLALRESLAQNFKGTVAGVRGFTANPTILVVDDDDLTANYIIGLDSRYALQRFFEIGSDLTETRRIIENQFERIILSRWEGLAKVFPAASKVLTLTGF